jgi:hypothetical protein
VIRKTSRSRGLTPLTGIDSQVIAILLRGEFTVNGFRNRDVRDQLFPTARSGRRILPTFPAARSASTKALSQIAV